MPSPESVEVVDPGSKVEVVVPESKAEVVATPEPAEVVESAKGADSDPECEVAGAEVVAATPCQSGLILVQPVLAANANM